MNGNNNDHNYPVYAFPDVVRDTILELQRMSFPRNFVCQG